MTPSSSAGIPGILGASLKGATVPPSAMFPSSLSNISHVVGDLGALAQSIAAQSAVTPSRHGPPLVAPSAAPPNLASAFGIAGLSRGVDGEPAQKQRRMHSYG